MTPLKIAHIITGLDLGGAETALYRFIVRSQGSQFINTVVSLKKAGTVGDRLSELDVGVRSLDMNPNIPNPGALMELSRHLKRLQPNIVQTWMYHADFVGGIAAKWAGIPVVWGIRNSTLDTKWSSPRTMALVRINAMLSRWVPAMIISNSRAARDWHVALGYAEKKLTFIPNGFDLEELGPQPDAPAQLRAELQLAVGSLLVGMLARYDPQKDHASFLEAAAILAKQSAEIHFVLAGTNIDWHNSQLKAEIERWPQLVNKVHLLGPRADAPTVISGLDILVSSSAYGESFPNVVAEAMALGVPCVVTDVGDSAELVGVAGIAVPVRAPQELAAAIEQVLRWPAKQRKQNMVAARSKIRTSFTIQGMLDSYQKLYGQILQESVKALDR